MMIRIVPGGMVVPPVSFDAQLYGLTTRSLNHNPPDYNKRDNSIKAANQAPAAAAIVATKTMC